MNFVHNRTVNIGGQQYTENRTIAVERALNFQKEVPLAKQGSLTTRTDNNTGVITMAASGHGIPSTTRVDIYWFESGVLKHRRGMTTGTVSGTTVPIDLGAGDNLPSTSTVIYVAVAVECEITITASEIIAFVMSSQKSGLFVVTQSDDTEIAYILLTEDGGVWSWYDGIGTATPLSDTVGKVYVSHRAIQGSGSVNTWTMKGTFTA
jgi:hypothetical protein